MRTPACRYARGCGVREVHKKKAHTVNFMNFTDGGTAVRALMAGCGGWRRPLSG